MMPLLPLLEKGVATKALFISEKGAVVMLGEGHGLSASNFATTGLMSSTDGLRGNGNFGWGWNQGVVIQLSGFADAFVIDEEERLVLNDGTAKGAAELIVVKRFLRLASRLIRGGIEIIAGVEGGVAEEFESRAVELVGAAFGDDVDDATGAAAVFRFEVGSDAKFGDGFDGENRCGGAERAGFVDGGVIAVAVVHVRAVEQEVVGAAARAVDGENAERAGGIGDLVGRAGDAGNEEDQFLIVAAIDGETW